MGRVEPVSFESRSGRRLVLRTCEPEDAATLVEVTRDSDRTAMEFGVTLPAERDLSIERRAELIREHLAEPDWLALGAFEPGSQGAAAGAIHFATLKYQRLRHAGTIGISVCSSCRDEGIGRALIAVVIGWARAHPTIERVGLNVFATNARAIHLYRSLGFIDQYVQRGFVKMGPGEYVDDIRMELWVKDRSNPTA